MYKFKLVILENQFYVDEFIESQLLRNEELLKKKNNGLELLTVRIDGNLERAESIISLTEENMLDEIGIKSIEEIQTFKNINPKTVNVDILRIMRSKKLLVVAKGFKKAKAVKEMLQGKISEARPATMVRKHSDVIIVLDKEAASELSGLYRRA